MPQRHPRVPTTSKTSYKQPTVHAIKQRHTHTNTHEHTQTHKHTNTQTHNRTHTRTHTHTQHTTHNTQHTRHKTQDARHKTQDTKQTQPTQQISNPSLPQPGARRRRRRSGRGLEGRAHQAASRSPRSGAEAGIRGTSNKSFVLVIN